MDLYNLSRYHIILYGQNDAKDLTVAHTHTHKKSLWVFYYDSIFS